MKFIHAHNWIFLIYEKQGRNKRKIRTSEHLRETFTTIYLFGTFT